MSEKQEDKRARERELRIAELTNGAWSGVDPNAIERRVDWGLPAGFGADFESFVPGQALTDQQVQGVIQNLRDGYQGAQDMTLDAYLADPRSAIKKEGGKYVFRPEGMTSDWYGIPKTGFWDGAGPFALVLAGMAMPFAASLGALGAGASAGAGAAEGAVGAAGGGLSAAEAASLGAVNSFDAGAMAQILGTDLTIGEKALAAVKAVMSTPGGATSQVLSSAIKFATGLDVSPGVIQTIGKVAAVGLAAGGSGGSSSGGVSGTAASQSAAANDAMALAREQWEWNKTRADELLPQQKALIQQQLDIGKTSADRAKSEWEIYNSLYLPAERQYVEKMTNWDTPDRRTQRIQEAVADVNRGYDAAGGTLERNLARSGVRPGGDGYVQAMGDLTRARAADTAGATNTTRRQVENEGIAGLERVTNIGRGRPSTSFAADQLALTAGNSANANTNQSTATTNAGLSSAQGWFNTGVGALNSAGSLQNTAYRNQSDNSAGIGKLIGQIFDWGFADGGLVRRGGRAKQPMGGYADGGLVRKAERKLQKHMGPMMRSHGYAEGGLVRGPGTETSDSIPAVIDGQEPTALSTGEAVLNAEAVQLVGEQFVERINQVGLERRGRPGRVIEGEARRVM